MIVVMAKARDGMERGEWPAEFWYRRSQWRKPPHAPIASGGTHPGADDDNAIALPSARERMLAVLAKFPDGETTMVLSKAAGMAGGRTRKILDAMVKDGIVVPVLLDKLNAKSKSCTSATSSSPSRARRTAMDRPMSDSTQIPRLVRHGTGYLCASSSTGSRHWSTCFVLGPDLEFSKGVWTTRLALAPFQGRGLGLVGCLVTSLEPQRKN